MKAFIVFTTLCAATLALELESCHDNVDKVCKLTSKGRKPLNDCTAKYGGFSHHNRDFQKYINHYFLRSFDYLLMSTNFANYNRNRPGFEKLFRGLSDEAWEQSIELIQYVTKRGGQMSFNFEDYQNYKNQTNLELYEFHSIAEALDIEKALASEAISLHRRAARESADYHDPEMASYLEEELMHKQRDSIRKLAGYSTELNNILEGPDSSLSIYLFDEFLQKE